MGAQDQRPRFYEGQYLAAADLAAVVDYLRAAQARHALAAHTWGIALGLDLTERDAPGQTARVDVTLTPGFGWDGYGRALAATRLTRLSESLFAAIPYNATVDDVAAGGTGRLVMVWLAYDEFESGLPQPGFETCASADQNARVNEDARFVIGDATPAQQRGALAIGASTVDAVQALRNFDPAAPLVWDTSVPHQAFPSGQLPQWLLPLGFVRWIAGNGTLGYFAQRDLRPADHAVDRIRAVRRYCGVVTENVEAAAGAIVLHRRDEDPGAYFNEPDGLHRRFGRRRALLAAGVGGTELLADLVWVEGHLRVEGDAKLANGRLLMRDTDGGDQGTPLYLARAGDDPPPPGAAGNRELRAVIGSDAQSDNRLVVGPEVGGSTPLQLNPNLVVVSSGRVGVNTATPVAGLEVKRDWDNAEDGAVRISGATPTVRLTAGPEGGGQSWALQVGSDGPGNFRIACRGIATAPDWKGVLQVTPSQRVGVNTITPRNPLGVRAAGTAEELLSFENPAGQTQWHLNQNLGGSNPGLNFCETNAAGGDGRLFLKAGGPVGIGTTAPARRLHVVGDRIRMASPDTTRVVDLRADGAGVDLQTETSHLYLRSTSPGITPGSNHIVMNPNGEDGLVGIGRVPAVEKVEVAGRVKFGVATELFAVGARVPLRALAGNVAATGSGAGDGYSYAHSGGGDSGDYVVLFTPPFPAAPVVVASLIDAINNDNVITLTNITATGFQAHTRDITGNNDPAGQDTAFAFVAFGQP